VSTLRMVIMFASKQTSESLMGDKDDDLRPGIRWKARRSSPKPLNSNSTNNLSSCGCATCKRLEGEDVQKLWRLLKHAIIRIYRDAGLVLNKSFIQQHGSELVASKSPISNEKLKDIVHR